MVMMLDLNMPRLGGTEVLQRLKEDDHAVPHPGLRADDDRQPVELDRCYALGAAACLVKPVDYGAFDDMIRRLAEFLMAARLPGEDLPGPLAWPLTPA